MMTDEAPEMGFNWTVRAPVTTLESLVEAAQNLANMAVDEELPEAIQKEATKAVLALLRAVQALPETSPTR